MRKHKKRPPEWVVLVLAIIAGVLTIVEKVLEIVLKLLDR